MTSRDRPEVGECPGNEKEKLVEAAARRLYEAEQAVYCEDWREWEALDWLERSRYGSVAKRFVRQDEAMSLANWLRGTPTATM